LHDSSDECMGEVKCRDPLFARHAINFPILKEFNPVKQIGKPVVQRFDRGKP